MLLKIIMGLVAMGFALTFYAIPILKLREIPLIVVVLVGVGMMVYEFWESLRDKEGDKHR